MLTSKARAYLKSLAHSYEPLFQVGKGGVTATLIKQVEDALVARELIKLSSLETAPEVPRKIAEQIAEQARCEVVRVIGRKMIFYRENPEKKEKIVLPRVRKV